jgi:NAD(P)-dependent dehydrogenase (short-subunit alcohol dehydrogenase family)
MDANRNGKGVVLVTGGAKRIGRAIALALAGDGWDLAIQYGRSAAEAADTVREIGSLGRRAASFDCDLADVAAVHALPARCAQALGPLNCVVNNASLFEYDCAADFDSELLERTMRINLAAPLLLARLLAAQLPAGRQGVVVNLLDQKLFNPNPDFLSYTLSKAALKEATTLLAQALAPRVRVVGVAPGITLMSGEQSESGFALAHTKTPLGRSSTPEDVAQAVVYAVSAPAVTGTTLLVDGGQHLVPSERDVMFLTESPLAPIPGQWGRGSGDRRE